MAGGETSWSGRVQNVSRGGLKFLINRRFEPGTLLHIEIESIKKDFPVTVLARVVHVRKHENTLWGLGCSFSKELMDDDLMALVGPDALDAD
jgi:hypothetical protein